MAYFAFAKVLMQSARFKEAETHAEIASGILKKLLPSSNALLPEIELIDAEALFEEHKLRKAAPQLEPNPLACDKIEGNKSPKALTRFFLDAAIFKQSPSCNAKSDVDESYRELIAANSGIDETDRIFVGKTMKSLNNVKPSINRPTVN